MGDIVVLKPSPFAVDDIARVIEAESGTKLEQRGDRYVGDACPVREHSQPKPGRFVVFPDGRWRCHGCATFGDLYDYIKAKRQVSFAQAKAILASEYRLRVESSKCGEVAVGADLDRMVRETWRIVRGMSEPPNIYRMGEATVRLVEVEDGRVIAQQIRDGDTIIRELEPLIFYYRKKDAEDGEEPERVPCTPPQRYGKMLLADRAAPWPFLGGILDAPFVTRSGRIARQPGFYADESVYLQPYGFAVPPVPDAPTDDDVREARRLLDEELLGDFPFVDAASHTHAIGLALTPVVRPLIDGPTPLYMATASKPGSGKGLVCQAALTPALGDSYAITTAPKNEDEAQKALTSFLLAGSRGIVLDNVETLKGGNLASLLTSKVFQGRRLGSNEILWLPNRATWASTGNNVQMSEELARRAVPIMLHVPKERPWERTNFRHTNLLGWALEHRGELLWALLVLVRRWWAAGQPKPTARPMGSFEAWHAVVGGILEAAGYTDFLANRDVFFNRADQEGEAWRAFFRAWWDDHVDDSGRETVPVETKELVQYAEDAEGFSLRGKDEADKARSLSAKLQKKEGAVYADMMLVRRKMKNAKGMMRSHWQLRLVGDEPTGTDTDGGSDSTPSTPGELRCGSANTADSFGNPHLFHTSHTDKVLPEKATEGHVQNAVRADIGNGVGGVEVVGNPQGFRASTPSTPETARCGVVWSTGPVHYITEPEQVADAVEDIRRAAGTAAVLGVDTETTGLDVVEDRVRLLQVSAGDAGTWVFDLFHLEPETVQPVLDLPTTYAFFNAAFDLPMLLRSGYRLPERLADVMLMDTVLGGKGRRRSLKMVAEDYLGIELDKSEQASSWGVSVLTESQIAYAAADAAVLVPLYHTIRRLLDEDDLTETMQLEHDCLAPMAEVIARGTPLDAERWREQAESRLAELRDAKAEVERVALEHGVTAGGQQRLDGTTGINWASDDQVKAAFASIDIKLEDTKSQTLSALDHPLAEALLAFKKASKRCSSYGLEWLRHIDPLGYAHGSWKQLGTATGRMSCTRPPLQTLPRDPAIRRCIHPPEGRVLIKADYSQIELRIVAEMTGETRMIEAYQQGRDLHRLTAALVMGKAEDEVTKLERQMAKAINFGLVYGMRAPRLRDYAAHDYGVEMSLDDAYRFRRAFFEAYPALAEWHDSVPPGEVETRTLAGRVRRGVVRDNDKYNSPVQGTGADGCKAALALFHRDSRRPQDAHVVMVVHDEIVVECSRDDAEHVKAVLTDCMVRGMSRYLRSVPVEVEAVVVRDYAGTPLDE